MALESLDWHERRNMNRRVGSEELTRDEYPATKKGDALSLCNRAQRPPSDLEVVAGPPQPKIVRPQPSTLNTFFWSSTRPSSKPSCIYS